MISPWVVAGWCLMGYLVGGLPVGWLMVRWQRYGLDLRKFGTGNIGTSNVYRHAGIDVAVVVGPLQFAQGFGPVLAARLVGLPVDAMMLVGVCAVAGNGWPVYMRFNGGRGVAVATGAVAAVSVAGLIALLRSPSSSPSSSFPRWCSCSAAREAGSAAPAASRFSSCSSFAGSRASPATSASTGTSGAAPTSVWCSTSAPAGR
jgi:hypothetical protein